MRVRPSRKRDGDEALFVFCEQEWPPRVRRLLRAIPSPPRCKLCHSPLGGLGRILPGPKFSPSRKNPNFCSSCFEQAPVGSKELDVGILFADVRGYTALGESLPSSALTG
jgi:adenylate cyclase